MLICFLLQKFGHFLFANLVKISAILHSSTKTTQARSQGFKVTVSFSGVYPEVLTSFCRIFENVFQIWSALAGYEELMKVNHSILAVKVD